MKQFYILLFSLIACLSCGSSATEDACVEIYKEGVEEVNVAQSHQELSDITYKVNKQIMEIANGPAGDEELTTKGSMAMQQAQQEFFRAIERRGRQLMPQ